MKIANKRASTPLAIMLLTFLVVGILIYSLFLFSIREKNFKKEISPPEDIDRVYADSEILDFYLGEIVREAKSRGDFIAAFSEILGKYRDSQDNYPISEMKQIESQVDGEHIKIENGKIKVSFEVVFNRDIVDFGDLVYTHNFKFEEQ